jgi:pheromone shutdown-related protein TraB
MGILLLPLKISEFNMPKITLVGTAHVSKESVKEVEETILKEKPKYVALELCEPRFEALTKKKKWEQTPISELIKGNKAYFLLAYSLLSAFEQKLGEKTGVKPGDEMLAGYKAAKKTGAEVVLVDRPIAITLKRAWKMSGIREKLRILKEFLFSIFGGEEIDEQTIEDLKKEDVLSELMKELAKVAPSAKKVLIDERDEYIAGKIKELDGDVVAVIGKGHQKGIEKRLKQSKRTDFEKLEEIPKSFFKWRWLFYGLTALIIGLFIWVGISNPAQLPEYWFWWSVINIGFTGLMGIIAMAHPLSIIAGALSSPFTSLSPTIGAGWVAGIVEAKIRKPSVKDFKGLRELKGIRDFWKNKFTRVLLVVSLVNTGSMIGTFVALPYLLSLL